MTYSINGSEIVLSGNVGAFMDDADFFDSRDVRAALKSIGKGRRATVHINSGGGVASEGTAIAALFAAHPGGVNVVVEGIAASAASVAACGASKISMSLGAVFMLHEAQGVTIGTAEAHKTSIAELSAVNASMADVYAAKSGRPLADIRTMMADETWLTADEAVRLGFADEVVGEGRDAKPARFAYADYKHAPRALMERQGKPKARKVPPTPVPTVEPRRADPEAQADPAAIAEMCIAADQMNLTVELIRDRVTLAQAEARIDLAGQIRPMLAMVKHKPGMTAELEARCLTGSMSLAQVRAAVLDAMASADETLPVDNKRPASNGQLDGRGMAQQSMLKLIERKHGPEAAAKARAKMQKGNRA